MSQKLTKKFLLILILLVGISGLSWAKENPVLDYFKNAELQCEDSQKQNIINALEDALNLSEKDIKEKRYKDYTGKENQWDLQTLILKHFLSNKNSTLGDHFYQDIKSEEVQKELKRFLNQLKKNSSSS